MMGACQLISVHSSLTSHPRAGEIGIPFDLDNKRAYRDGDFTNQEKALDASLNACDGENMLNYTIWNYCTQNSHSWGDGWNNEDLSIWSADDQQARAGNRRRGAGTPSSSTSRLSLAEPPPSPKKLALAGPASDPPASSDLHEGSRAPRAFVRPFPVRTRGSPLSFSFDIATATFKLEILSDAKPDSEDLATEIFLPSLHFGVGAEADHSHLGARSRLDVQASAGRWEVKGDTLLWFTPAGRQSIQVRRELPHNGSAWYAPPLDAPARHSA